PVCALFATRDLDEAVRLANATRYGLVAAVFTRDLGVALDVASRLEAGLVRVNAPTTGVDYHAPFGGEKASGQGPREQGRAARDERRRRSHPAAPPRHAPPSSGWSWRPPTPRGARARCSPPPAPTGGGASGPCRGAPSPRPPSSRSSPAYPGTPLGSRLPL